MVYIPLEAVVSKWYGEAEKRLAKMLALTAQLSQASLEGALHHDAAVRGGGARARGGVLLFLDEIETVSLSLLCVGGCMRACVRACVCACVGVYMYISTCTYTHIYILYVDTYIHICIYIHLTYRWDSRGMGTRTRRRGACCRCCCGASMGSKARRASCW